MIRRLHVDNAQVLIDAIDEACPEFIRHHKHVDRDGLLIRHCIYLNFRPVHKRNASNCCIGRVAATPFFRAPLKSQWITTEAATRCTTAGLGTCGRAIIRSGRGDKDDQDVLKERTPKGC